VAERNLFPAQRICFTEITALNALKLIAQINLDSGEKSRKFRIESSKNQQLIFGESGFLRTTQAENRRRSR